MEVISNNPAFGLNALGGAVAVQMKDGFNFQGTTLDLMGGSFGRAQGVAAMGQAGRAVGRLYRHRRRARRAATANSAAPICAASTATSATRPSRRSSTSPPAAPATISAPRRRRRSSSCSRAGATSTRRRSPRSIRSATSTPPPTSNVDADLEPAGERACALVLSIDAGRQPDRRAALRRSDACCASTTTRRPPTASTASSSPTRSRRARRSARSTARTRRPPASARALQATNTDKLFGHDNHFVIGASFDYGVTHFGASAELGTINPDFAVADLRHVPRRFRLQSAACRPSARSR